MLAIFGMFKVFFIVKRDIQSNEIWQMAVYDIFQKVLFGSLYSKTNLAQNDNYISPGKCLLKDLT